MNQFTSISSFCNALGFAGPEHPHFNIAFGHKEDDEYEGIEFSADFYIISFQKIETGNVGYGKTKYDHELGKMMFFKPRQIIIFNSVKNAEDCFLVMFHEDFISGSPVYHEVKRYGFFDYETNEALFVSPSEEKTIWNLVRTMEQESRNNSDDLSKPIMISHLDTLLKYSQRFYKRQFIDRSTLTGTVVTRFQNLLISYFEQKIITESGLPTVAYMAEKMNVSPRYLSDLLKRETGKTALEVIHLFLISEAKNRLSEGKLNITEISYALGFENPTYFSRLFKKEVGVTPNIFREQKLN